MKDFRDIGRKVLFTLLFVVLVLFSLWIVQGGVFSLWVGLSIAGGMGAILSSIYVRWTRRRAGPTKLAAGTASCPSCRSLQTDWVVSVRSDGCDAHHHRCFQCGHAF